MVSKEDRNYIEVSRKYNIRLCTFKLETFLLFEQGYKPSEVAYLLRHAQPIAEDKTFGRTIRRYYYDWKKAQKKKE
jgi:hypothetical protein